MPYPFPVLFQVGPFSVFTYGLFMLLGIIGALFFALQRRGEISEDNIYNILIISLVSGLVGARLAFFMFAPQYLNSFYDFIAIWEGGMSWFGGFFLALASVYFYCRKKKINYLKVLDAFALGLPLAIAVTRVGAFIAGANPGLPTDLPWAVMLDGVATHPAALYHAFANFLIFFILLWVSGRTVLPRKFGSGYLFMMFTLLFGVERFVNDFFRNYDSTIVIMLSHIVPVILIIVSLVLLSSLRKKN